MIECFSSGLTTLDHQRTNTPLEFKAEGPATVCLFHTSISTPKLTFLRQSALIIVKHSLQSRGSIGIMNSKRGLRVQLWIAWVMIIHSAPCILLSGIPTVTIHHAHFCAEERIYGSHNSSVFHRDAATLFDTQSVFLVCLGFSPALWVTKVTYLIFLE